MMALIVDELHVNMPLLRKEAAKKNLLKNLEETIRNVEFKHGTCSGDLPPIEKLRDALARADWSKFRQVYSVPEKLFTCCWNPLKHENIFPGTHCRLQ